MAALSNYLGNNLSGGEPSNNLSASSASYQSILGGLLVELWHSQLGIATVSGNVDTWTGQVRGIVLQAPGAAQRPVYAADGSNFQGKSVVQCALTGAKCLQQLAAQSPSIFLAGSRPWVGLLGRVRSYPGATAGIEVVVLDFPITQVIGDLQTAPTPVVSSVFAGSTASLSDNSTAVRLLGGGLSSSGVNTVSVNGVASNTSGSGLSIPADGKVVSLGANGAGSLGIDLSAVLLFFCNAYPSAAQLFGIVALAQAEFGPF